MKCIINWLCLSSTTCEILLAILILRYTLTTSFGGKSQYFLSTFSTIRLLLFAICPHRQQQPFQTSPITSIHLLERVRENRKMDSFVCSNHAFATRFRLFLVRIPLVFIILCICLSNVVSCRKLMFPHSVYSKLSQRDFPFVVLLSDILAQESN